MSPRSVLGPAIIDFAAYHQSRKNRVCHYIGLPAIAASVLGALAKIELASVDLGVVLLGATLVLDLVLNVRIALGVLALGALLWAGARMLPLEALGALFAVGWIAQLVGHRVFEKNAPAFVKNAVHLFVGPRWMINKLVRALPDGAPAGGEAQQHVGKGEGEPFHRT